MNTKQIVTFELIAENIDQVSFKTLCDNIDTQYKVFIKREVGFDELFILKIEDRLLYFVFTNDYTPLITLFQNLNIPPKKLTIRANTNESISLLTDTIARRNTTKRIDIQFIKGLKESYKIAKEHDALGKILNQMLSKVLREQQFINRETVLGKIIVTYASNILDQIDRKICNTDKKKEFKHLHILSEMMIKNTINY